MTIDDKIRDKKQQQNINIEAANMFEKTNKNY